MKSANIPQIHTSPRGAAHTCQEGEPAAAVTRDGSTGSRTPQGEEGGTPTPKLAQKRVGEASTLGGRQYHLAARSTHGCYEVSACTQEAIPVSARRVRGYTEVEERAK